MNAEQKARKHAETCSECFVPIIDDEGNPGLFSGACGVGVNLLADYSISIGEGVPGWVKLNT